MAATRTGTRSVNATVAAVLGVAFVLVGLAGFVVSDTLAATDDDALLGFEVNRLHDVVHLLIGVALLGASRRTARARRLNLLIGATYVLLGIVGWSIQDTPANVLALNVPDHLLHLASGGLLVAVALAADTRSRLRV